MQNNKYEAMTAVRELKEEITCLYRDMIGSGKEERDQLKEKVRKLSGLQREDGSWSALDDLRVDADFRIDFAYMPTYMATAALMHAMNLGITGSIIEESLSRGLEFACGRNLRGHGFESVRGQLEALNIYKDAGLYEWMQNHAEEYPKFTAMIQGIIHTYRRAIASGNVHADWDHDFSAEYQHEIDDFDSCANPEVWYAAYGSNICMERFIRYIDRCEDQTPPSENKPYRLPFDIYFAGKSILWNRKGTAYLDDTKAGMSLGRIYRIRRKQFDRIREMEGPNYSKAVFLGFVDEIPVYTFTAENRRSDRIVPSVEYMDTILKGLKETYPRISEIALRTYLFGKGILEREDLQVLGFIRSAEHGVSLQDIADDESCPGITKTREAVCKLNDLQLVRQDGRSVRRGDQLKDAEAVVYSREENRELADILLITEVCAGYRR